MLLKDQAAAAEMRDALRGQAQAGKGAELLKSIEMEFDQAAQDPCDFQNRDLTRRNAFISKIRKIAYRIASELSRPVK
jgi:hypothetical protein